MSHALCQRGRLGAKWCSSDCILHIIWRGDTCSLKLGSHLVNKNPTFGLQSRNKSERGANIKEITHARKANFNKNWFATTWRRRVRTCRVAILTEHPPTSFYVRTLCNGNVIYVRRCKILLKTFSWLYFIYLLWYFGKSGLLALGEGNWNRKVHAAASLMQFHCIRCDFKTFHRISCLLKQNSADALFVWCSSESRKCFDSQLINWKFLFLLTEPTPGGRRHEELFFFRGRARITNEQTTEDAELLTNFIIRARLQRLLSAFEYFRHYSILSLCFLWRSKFNKSNKREKHRRKFKLM